MPWFEEHVNKRDGEIGRIISTRPSRTYQNVDQQYRSRRKCEVDVPEAYRSELEARILSHQKRIQAEIKRLGPSA